MNLVLTPNYMELHFSLGLLFFGGRKIFRGSILKENNDLYHQKIKDK